MINNTLSIQEVMKSILTCFVDSVWFSAGEYGTGYLHIGTNSFSPWSWFWLFFFLVSNLLNTGDRYQITLIDSLWSASVVFLPALRRSTRGAEVLRTRAHAGCQSEPKCVWPCPYEAVQSPEESLHIWFLSFPLAVRVIFIYLECHKTNCAVAHSTFPWICFHLFLCYKHSIMRRVVTLLNQVASTLQDNKGLQAQMDSAVKAANQWKEDNLLLKQVSPDKSLMMIKLLSFSF